jgi:hypothetical protein
LSLNGIDPFFHFGPSGLCDCGTQTRTIGPFMVRHLWCAIYGAPFEDEATPAFIEAFE